MTSLRPVVASTAALVRCGLALLVASAAATAPAASSDTPPLQSLPEVVVSRYLGTWYQVALFPNRFQSQCVSDTTATYAARPDGALEVLNQCRLADGRVDAARGVARPARPIENDRLRPAQMTVSFLPAWLQWLPVGRGDYWVIDRAEDGRYAVVSEPTRRYLWVLSRTPVLSPEDETAIRSRLRTQHFDLSRWAAHPHGKPAATAP